MLIFHTEEIFFFFYKNFKLIYPFVKLTTKKNIIPNKISTFSGKNQIKLSQSSIINSPTHNFQLYFQIQNKTINTSDQMLISPITKFQNQTFRL